MPYEEITSLEQAKEVIAEQDRKIGELSRQVEYYEDSRGKRSQWLRKAKQDAGFNPNVSFDVVWDKTLTAYKKQKER